MKPLPLLLLGAAGAVLAAIALRAPEPTYEPPRTVPRQIAAAPAPGQVLRSFDVAGMCCDGCSGRLFTAVLGRSGVEAAAIRVEEGRLELLCDARLDADDLARTLTFDKYTVTPRP